MWAALELDATLSAAALAKESYGSFATAWHVRRDFLLLRGGSSRRTPPSEPKKKPGGVDLRAISDRSQNQAGKRPGPEAIRPVSIRTRSVNEEKAPKPEFFGGANRDRADDLVVATLPNRAYQRARG